MGSWSHPFAQARFEYSWHIESHHIWWFVYLPSFPSTFSTCVPPKNGCPPPLHQPISSEALRGSRESDEERHVLLCSSCDGTLANGETQGLKRLKSYEKWHVPINLVYQRKTRGSTLSRRKWESKKAPRNNSGCWSAVGSPAVFYWTRQHIVGAV